MDSYGFTCMSFVLTSTPHCLNSCQPDTIFCRTAL